MALWDGLPLNTPTVVAQTGLTQTVATRTSDPLIGGRGTVEYPPAPGSPEANRIQIYQAVRDALAQLRTIQTQTATFAAQADYTTANLTNLNDLLHKSQAIATGLGIIATDLIRIVRVLSNQYDGTT